MTQRMDDILVGCVFFARTKRGREEKGMSISHFGGWMDKLALTLFMFNKGIFVGHLSFLFTLFLSLSSFSSSVPPPTWYPAFSAPIHATRLPLVPPMVVVAVSSAVPLRRFPLLPHPLVAHSLHLHLLLLFLHLVHYYQMTLLRAFAPFRAAPLSRHFGDDDDPCPVTPFGSCAGATL